MKRYDSFLDTPISRSVSFDDLKDLVALAKKQEETIRCLEQEVAILQQENDFLKNP